MNIATFIILLVSLWSFSEAFRWRPNLPERPPPNKSTLKLVHILFRHGNRNPEQNSVWEENKFTDASYYPNGFGQLTNKGKLTEYNLGKLLRQRYGSFLGDIWDIDIQEFRSTSYNRTKMSGLLVMAGLWPPKGKNIWSDELPWQPIPYNYELCSNDPITFPVSCSTFSKLIDEAYESEKTQNYLDEKYSEVADTVYKNTGISNYIFMAFGIFDVLKVQDDLGLPLDEWTKSVYPEPLNSLAVDIYNVLTSTTSLKQLLAGIFLKKVISDTQSLINGTISPSTRKLFIYSAHDLNVGSSILSLGYQISKTPQYGSGIFFEVHEINKVWGFKVFYNDYTDGSPHPVTLPGCKHFCPIEEFTSLLEEILPTGDVCQGDSTTFTQQKYDFFKYL